MEREGERESQARYIDTYACIHLSLCLGYIIFFTSNVVHVFFLFPFLFLFSIDIRDMNFSMLSTKPMYSVVSVQ